MKKIFLTQNQFALVDDEDFEYLNQWKWHYNQGYAVRNSKYIKGIRRIGILMHRVIMNPPKNLEVDHIDGNGLNNLGDNLRIATHKMNSANRPKSKNNTSGYKGVTFDKKSNKWMVQTRLNGKRKYLGRFSSIQEAAECYNDNAKIIFGKFAHLNEVYPK